MKSNVIVPRRYSCNTCKAKDYETLDENGVYICHECKTVFFVLNADLSDDVYSKANKTMDEFLAGHPEYKEL